MTPSTFALKSFSRKPGSIGGVIVHLSDSRVRPFPGRLRIFLRGADSHSIAALIPACRAKGLRVATVRGVLRALSTVLSQTVEDELLPANPAVGLGRYLRQGDEPELEIDPFTRDEAPRLLEVARRRWRRTPESAGTSRATPASQRARGSFTSLKAMVPIGSC